METIKVFAAACRRLLLVAGLAWLGLSTAWAAVTHVASTSVVSDGKTSSLTLTLPAGIKTNDVLIAAVSHKSRNGTWPAAPSGWTKVLASDSSQEPDMRVWYRVATASDTAGAAVVFSLPTTETEHNDSDHKDDPDESKESFTLERSAGGISAYRGVDTKSPVVASKIDKNNNNSYSTAPSITPGITNTMLVAIWTANFANVTTLPSGMTQVYGGASIYTCASSDWVGWLKCLYNKYLSGQDLTKISITSAYEVWPTSGATGDRKAILTAKENSHGALLALRPSAAVGPDHYELTLAPTSAKCTATSVTVTACGDSSSPCTTPFTGVSGTTANFATSAGLLGAGTLTFNAAGIASTTLLNSAGGVSTVTLSGEQTAASNSRQCCTGSSCSVANSCSTTFGAPGLVLATANLRSGASIPTQTAGVTSGTFYVQPESCGGLSVPALTSVQFGYTCSNPASCASSNLMSINGGSATTIARNNNGSQSSRTPVTLASDGAFTLSYSDVGQVTLNVQATMNGGTVSLSSNPFVVKPFGLVVSDIKQSASPNLANPAASSASGVAFLKAGQNFSATVTATNAAGGATPSFGKETSPEGVLLSPTLVLPISGSAGTLASGSIAGGNFVNGVATVSDLTWSEVGIMKLTPSVADGDYLGAGAVTGTASSNIGRFYPDHFDVVAGTITPAMTTFSYMGQPFGISLTLSAKNASGGTVSNYVGEFAKLNTATAGALGLQASGKPGSSATALDLSSRLSVVGTPTGSWVAGQYAGAALLSFSRPPNGVSGLTGATSWGPFEPLSVRVSPVDTDGVACAATPCSAALDSVMRLGRLRLFNTISGGVQKPKVDMIAQYYAAGGRWLTNGLDNQTALQPSNVIGSAPLGTLTAPLAAQAVTVMSNGLASVTFAAPATPQSGSFDIALNLSASGNDTSCNASHGGGAAGLVWLKDYGYTDCVSGAGAWAQDPSARVKLQSATAAAVAKQRFIYLRERY